MRVAIDAGHGGHDSGAVALDGTKEKDIVLDYAEVINDILTELGEETKMIRVNDDFIGLHLRASRADDWGADCLVSIHANAASRAAANGAWVIYDDKTKEDNGKALARYIFDEMDQIPGVGDQDPEAEVYPDGTGWVGGRQLAVISQSRCPAVLVELGFLTNPNDLADLKNPDVRNKICNAIAAGIRLWGIHKGIPIGTPTTPPSVEDSTPEPVHSKFPVNVKAVSRRPSRTVVSEYSNDRETFGCLVVRFLRAAEEDQRIRDQLGPLAIFALSYVNDKLSEALDCGDPLIQ